MYSGTYNTILTTHSLNTTSFIGLSVLLVFNHIYYWWSNWYSNFTPVINYCFLVFYQMTINLTKNIPNKNLNSFSLLHLLIQFMHLHTSGDWRGTLWTLLVTFRIVIIRCTENFWSRCIYDNKLLSQLQHFQACGWKQILHMVGTHI